jgi:hypothetical protein
MALARAIFILDGLVRTLEPRNIACVFDGNEAIAKRGADEIKFKIVEKIAAPQPDDRGNESRRATSPEWGFG